MPRKYAKIQPCTIAELQLQRIGDRTYSFVIPTVGATTHQQAKLRRWGLAILLSAPSIAVGGGLQVPKYLLLRYPLQLTRTYTWDYSTTGCVSGIMVDSDPGLRSVIALEQDSDGIHWKVAANNIEDRRTMADCQKFRKGQDAGGIVFYANPFIHGFPWSVPDTIANKHVLLALKKQPFRRYKGSGSTLT